MELCHATIIKLAGYGNVWSIASLWGGGGYFAGIFMDTPHLGQHVSGDTVETIQAQSWEMIAMTQSHLIMVMQLRCTETNLINS